MRAVLQSCGAILAMAAAAFGQDKMPWQPNLETAQRVAAETNRLVLIHFWAPWCHPCVRLDREVFSNADTAKGLEANFVVVKLNADDAPGTTRLYGVSSIPTDVITTPTGRMVSQVQSPPSVAQYVAQMNQAAEGHRSLARKPERPTVQQASPPLGSGAAYRPQSSPGAAPPAYQASALRQNAPAGNDRYAEYFPQQQSQALQANSRHGHVTPAQAYSAVPGAAPTGTSPNPVDPYTGPAGPQSPAVDPYAPRAASQPPAVDPYAASAALQPPATDPYAAPPTAQPPAVNPYAASPPPVQQGSTATPYSVAPAPAPPMAQPSAAAIGQAPYNAQLHTTAPASTQRSSAPQLPPGCPPVGLDGNCPVTLVERKRWVLGHQGYGVVHRGRTYLFLGPQEKEKFLAEPDRYSPVLSGIDPVLALDNGAAVPGRREFGVFGADGQVYLFADEKSRAQFEANEQAYANRARQATQTQYQAMRPGQ